MGAFGFRSYGPPEVPEPMEVEKPRAADDGVLIRVATAAGVNPADRRLRSGQPRFAARPKMPFVPGSDGAGVITRGRGATTPYSADTANVVEATEGAGARRPVAISPSGFWIDPHDVPFARLWVEPPLAGSFRRPYADMAVMEEYVQESGPDWRVVRPPRPTRGSPTDRYRAARGRNVPGAYHLSRADLADFVVSSLDEPATYYGAFLAVAGPRGGRATARSPRNTREGAKRWSRE